MGNTQGVWILHGALWTLNFLSLGELTAAANDRHGIVKGTAGLNHARYCRESKHQEDSDITHGKGTQGF